MIDPDLQTLDDVRARLADLPGPDNAALAAARARNGQLTKPPGALGRLEEIAIWIAGWQGSDRPVIAAPQIAVFAGNHGVAARGVSAFPPDVTAQMVANFDAGGAAINQLARVAGARLDIVALDLDRPTRDFSEGPAMDEADLCAAMARGWASVAAETDLLVVGEMGIGNTTAAAAIATALHGGDPTHWTGPGTGLDATGVLRKAEVVARAVAANPGAAQDGLEALRCLGGRELAAMAGAILAARHRRIPVVLDGFICTAAAATLEAARPGALDHAVAGHLSSEAGHGPLLGALGKTPLLSLGLRLGEGSGAAVAIGVMKSAAACLSGMATFAEAGVSGG